jgi:hypothetical protein
LHHQGKETEIRLSRNSHYEFAMHRHYRWLFYEFATHTSRISGRNGAYALATLRNLLLGLFELQKHRGQTKARTFPGWRRKLTGSQKIQLLTQKI